MEQITLPFPSLQFLSAHAIGRRMVSMKADNDYWYNNHSLRKCELTVDKLRIPPELKEYVKNVLRGLFVQVQEWMLHSGENPGADIVLDARGNLDHKKMAQHYFAKRYKAEFHREDFRPLCRFLEHFSFHFPSCCNREFVSLVANLQKTNTSLEGPEYRLVDDDMHVVFRFVNRRRVTRHSSVPPEFNALIGWNTRPLTISMEQKDVLVIYHVYPCIYDEDMFRIHLDLFEPSQRLQFVKQVLDVKMFRSLSQNVISFLNVLDPEMRRDGLLYLNEVDFSDSTFWFMKCWLIPGYESLFIPMMKLVVLNMDSWMYVLFFVALVDKIDLIGYDSLLLPFWELLPASETSVFHSVLEDHNNERHGRLKGAMKKLSQTNRTLFHLVFDDVSATLPKEQARRLLRDILDWQVWQNENWYSFRN